MFSYLSKKIALPANLEIIYINWNFKLNYIALCGKSNLLKVIRLAADFEYNETQNVKPNVSIDFNQSLIGHEGDVLKVTWNYKKDKLSSYDTNGLIIVWGLIDGLWQKEMVNNRNKSSIIDISWDGSGEKIAILYLDGTLIVGGIDGTRHLMQEYDIKPTTFAWHPDSKYFYIGIESGVVQKFDEKGIFIKKVDLQEMKLSSKECNIPISNICLKETLNSVLNNTQDNLSEGTLNKYNFGLIDPCFNIISTCQIVVYGETCQISYDEDSKLPLILDVGSEILASSLSQCANFVALALSPNPILLETANNPIEDTTGESADQFIEIKIFHTVTGKLLGAVNLTRSQNSVVGISWGPSCHYLIAATGNSIYVIRLHHDYMWTCSETAQALVYAWNQPSWLPLKTSVTPTKKSSNPQSPNISSGATTLHLTFATFVWPELNVIADHKLYLSAPSGNKNRENSEDLNFGDGDLSLCNYGICSSQNVIAFLRYGTRRNDRIESKTDGLDDSSDDILEAQEYTQITFYGTEANVLCEKRIEIQSKFYGFTPDGSLLITASRKSFCAFFMSPNHMLANQHRTSKTTNTQSVVQYERIFHVDDIPSSIQDAITDIPEAYRVTKDPISALNSSLKYLVIGRKSGNLNLYSLPKITFLTKIIVPHVHTVEYKFIYLNSDSACIATLNHGGELRFVVMPDEEIQSHSMAPALKKLRVALKRFFINDVWSFVWDKEHPMGFCYEQKSKLYQCCDLAHLTNNKTVQDSHGFEEISSSAKGPILMVKEMRDETQIKLIHLDALFKTPWTPTSNIIYPLSDSGKTKEIRQLLEAGKLKEAISLIEAKPQKFLWNILYDYSLEHFDLSTAQRAACKTQNYAALYTLSQAKRAGDNNNLAEQKAIMSLLAGDLDSAERNYIESGKKLELVEFYRKTGNLYKMLETVRRCIEEQKHKDRMALASDSMQRHQSDDHSTLKKLCSLKTEALLGMAEHYYTKKNWYKAANFYKEAKSYEMAVECYINSNDYDKMSQLIKNLDGKGKGEILENLASILASQGLCAQAVDCYLKLESYDKAFSVAIEMNEWDLIINQLLPQITKMQPSQEAVKLDNIKSLLKQKVEKSPISSTQKINLYASYGEPMKGAHLLTLKLDGLRDEPELRKNLVLMKKVHVCMALLTIEQRKLDRGILPIRDSTNTQQRTSLPLGGGENTTLLKSKTGLGEIIREDLINERVSPRGNIWRNAEAYHYAILAHNQLYRGEFIDAMITSLALRSYIDILDSTMVYVLIALTSYGCKHNGIYTQALKTLQTSMPTSEQNDDQQLLASTPKNTKDPMYPPVKSSTQLVGTSHLEAYLTFCESCGNAIPLYKLAEAMGKDQNYECPTCCKTIKIDPVYKCSLTGRPLLINAGITTNLADLSTGKMTLNSTNKKTSTSSGSILESICGDIWLCRVCKHGLYLEALGKLFPDDKNANLKCCPFCHSPV